MTTGKRIDFAPVKRRGVGRASVARGHAVTVNRTAAAKPTVKMPSTGTRIVRRRVGAKPAVRTTVRTAVKPAVKSTMRSTTKPTMKSAPKSMSTRTAAAPKVAPARKSGVKLGEIEDLNPRFVMMNVPKRPLNDGKESRPVKDTASEAKSKRIGARLRLKSGKKNAARSEVVQDAPKKAEFDTGRSSQKVAYTLPRSPFINQDKVAKRPLSKNVYRASSSNAGVIASNKASGKVGTTTIIDKPEKESRIGVVVVIILTIILGAVAGTVAFLLLPK